MKCDQCEKEIEKRNVFCSDKCRLKHFRTKRIVTGIADNTDQLKSKQTTHKETATIAVPKTLEKVAKEVVATKRPNNQDDKDFIKDM